MGLRPSINAQRVTTLVSRSEKECPASATIAGELLAQPNTAFKIVSKTLTIVPNQVIDFICQEVELSNEFAESMIRNENNFIVE